MTFLFGQMYHGCQSNCVLCCVQPFVTLWAVVHQAPLSLGFSDKNTGMGLPFCLPGIKPISPALQAVSLLAELLGKLVPWLPED